MNQFHIRSLTLINNSRLRNLGIPEFHIDIGDEKFIGIIGDNGAGKSTIMAEFTPLPIYGVYVKKEVGRKKMTLGNDKFEYDIEYIFEPNGDDSHKCSCYIMRRDLIARTKEDLNVGGGLKNGVAIIDRIFGINSVSEMVYNLTSERLSFIRMTTGERRNFLQNFLTGLEDIKKVANEIQEKNRFIGNLNKANEKKLSNMEDLGLLENRLIEYESRLLILSDELLDLEYAQMSMDDNEETLQQNERILTINQNKEKLYRTSILPIYTEYNVPFAHNVYSYLNNILSEIKTLETILVELNIKIIELESINEKEAIRLKIESDSSIMNSMDKYKYYEELFSDMSSIVLADDLDEVKSLKMFIDNMPNIHTTLDLDKNYKAILEINNSDSINELNSTSGVIDKIHKLEEHADLHRNTLLKYELNDDLKKKVEIKDECRKCSVVESIFSYDNDKEKITKELRNIEEEIAAYTDILRDREALKYKAKEFLIFSASVNRQLSALKKYIPNFHLSDVIENKRYSELSMLFSNIISNTADYSRYILLKEIKTLQETIKKDEFKSREEREKSIISYKERYSQIKDEKNRLEEIGKKLQRIVDRYDKNDIVHTEETIKKEIERLEKEIHELIKINAELKEKIEKQYKIKEMLDNKEKFIEQITSDIDQVKTTIAIRNELVKDHMKHGKLNREFNLINKIINVNLISKVINVFMENLKNKTNQLFHDVNLNYVVKEVIINNSEFTIKILDKTTNITSVDINDMSLGERGLNGMAVTLAMQDLIDSGYGVVTMDEVDGPLSKMNRIRFIDILLRYIDTRNKQIVCISQNGHFEVYKDRIALVVLKGAEAIDGVKKVLWDYNKK